MNAMEWENLRIRQRVTMRYPSGILQEAVLIGNDDGILNFQFGGFLRESVGPVFDISLNERRDWTFGERQPGMFN
jgi:hypothetical protein